MSNNEMNQVFNSSLVEIILIRAMDIEIDITDTTIEKYDKTTGNYETHTLCLLRGVEDKDITAWLNEKSIAGYRSLQSVYSNGCGTCNKKCVGCK